MTENVIQVVLVEDDDSLRLGTTQGLELEGFAVRPFADARSALRTIEREFAGVVISDIRMSGMDGLELFEKLREIDCDMQLIFTTAHGDVDLAVRAMKNGAADFFTKPFSISRLAHSVNRAAEKRALTIENRKLREELRARTTGDLLGQSQAAIRLERVTREAARTDADLLLRGGPGSGKSLLAREIHDLSPRADRPLVVIDPAILVNEEADLLVFGRDPSVAMSRSGMIERANGGTLVLDGVDQFPEAATARLISFVDNRFFHSLGGHRPTHVDVRIIATASDRITGGPPLGPGVAGLISRLNGIALSLPDLNDRRDDIPLFFRKFVSEYELQLGREAQPPSEDEWRHLLTHDWPGNLRELRMFAQNFVMGLTEISNSQTEVSEKGGLKTMLAQFEKTIIEDALRSHEGNVTQVQRELELPRKTLYDKLAKHGIRPSDFRTTLP
ncbi:MAG: DNA-binding response regulator [Sphingomonadaceae bacterium]|nr:DNA-binding response regulator [Sphingomonadaceae bacterium]|tara:strand:+ start:1920 stop:3254 length:1335 start_codon:yes stop_codon:yes gene_type:complete